MSATYVSVITTKATSQYACQTPKLNRTNIQAQTAAHAISQIKFDKVIVWDGGHQGPNGTGATANFMQIMRDIGGVDMPDYFSKFQPGAIGDAKLTNAPDFKAPYQYLCKIRHMLAIKSDESTKGYSPINSRVSRMNEVHLDNYVRL